MFTSVITPETVNARAHDAKHVLALRKYPSRSLTSASANVIYYITCTLCKRLYIGEMERRLGDRFREHLRDVEKDNKDASRPVARYLNLHNHSKKHMAVCGLSTTSTKHGKSQNSRTKNYFSNRHS